MKILNPGKRKGELETVDFRLTRKEILLVHTGLKPCLRSLDYGKRCGSYPNTDFFRLYPHLRPRDGRFEQRFLDYILSAWDVMVQWVEDKNAKSHRVRIDPIAIAILAFFVRVAGVQMRHRHVTSPVSNPKQIGARLSRKFENQRRRALRKARAAGQGETYAGLAERWHQFQLWMRTHFLYCRCHRPSPQSTRQRNQLYISECQKVAKKVIAEYELEMPEAEELRRLVKLAIRYSRRGRLGVGLRTLLEGDSESFFIWGRFLKKRLRPPTESKRMESV